jgi:hypothetical protein
MRGRMTSKAPSVASSKSGVFSRARAPLPLHRPFETSIHPDAGLLQVRSLEWAEGMGLVTGEAVAKLASAKLGRLVARANPHGCPRVLQIAADWTTLFCELDDRLEKLPNPDAVRTVLDRVFLALTGGLTVGDALVTAARDLHKRLRSMARAAWLGRFAAKHSELFDAFELESRVRAGETTLDLATYLAMREVTVGIPIEVELSHLARGIELPNEASRDARRMVRHASNLIGWANDLFTAEKEEAAGDPNNLVLVLARSLGLDRDAARQHAIRMHDREADALAVAISDAGARGSTALQLHGYVQSAWVRGHLEWAAETGRYRA